MLVASRTLSMMQAWFSSSEMMMSPASQKVGKVASIAVQQETKQEAASTPRNLAIVRSSVVWGSKLPQMKRTEAVPAP